MSDEVDVNQSDDTISSWTREGLPEQVVCECQVSSSPTVFLTSRQILALAQSRHLLVKPSQLEDVEGYSTMIGGFGTVRVARMNNQLVAVKEIRVTGAPADRARFSMVRPHIKVDNPQRGITSLRAEIRPRVEGVGSSRSPKPPQAIWVLYELRHVHRPVYLSLLRSRTHRRVHRHQQTEPRRAIEIRESTAILLYCYTD